MEDAAWRRPSQHIRNPQPSKHHKVEPLPPPVPLPLETAEPPSSCAIASDEARPALRRLHEFGTVPKERVVLRLPTTMTPLHLVRTADHDAEAQEAADFTLYRLCFWPLHVWKRVARQSSTERRAFVNVVTEGLLRQRFWRFWVLHSRVQRTFTDARAALVRFLRTQAIEDAFEHWCGKWDRARRCLDVLHSAELKRLRATIVLASPFKVLRIYAHIRALVRCRSYGRTFLLAESHVPPLVFPYQALRDEVSSTLIDPIPPNAYAP